MLAAGGQSPYVVRGVVLLTRPKRVGYTNYVRALAASGHQDALWLKLVDNLHNTWEQRLLAVPADAEVRRRAAGMRPRYERGKRVLCGALGIAYPPCFEADGPASDAPLAEDFLRA